MPSVLFPSLLLSFLFSFPFFLLFVSLFLVFVMYFLSNYLILIMSFNSFDLGLYLMFILDITKMLLDKADIQYSIILLNIICLP